MLRIQESTERNRVVFSLSGRIEAEDVAELQRLCRSETDDHKLVLDLGDVRLVNRDAIKFLADCEANGTKLRNCPPYVREWISKEREGNNLRQD
jgi:anti-anti-sigma regulatory factor